MTIDKIEISSGKASANGIEFEDQYQEAAKKIAIHEAGKSSGPLMTPDSIIDGTYPVNPIEVETVYQTLMSGPGPQSNMSDVHPNDKNAAEEWWEKYGKNDPCSTRKLRIVAEKKEPSLEDKRNDMARETWIKNIMRVEGWSREEAEDLHRRIVVGEPAVKDDAMYLKGYYTKAQLRTFVNEGEQSPATQELMWKEVWAIFGKETNEEDSDYKELMRTFTISRKS